MLIVLIGKAIPEIKYLLIAPKRAIFAALFGRERAGNASLSLL